MKITGIICEYNPLHLGHAHQIREIRRLQGADIGIVCLMSGNYVQRGHPAIVDKSLRAKAAIFAGADLVLELPLTVSLSSAEGFAKGGVDILSPFCDSLCFGAETADAAALAQIARTLLSPQFPPALREGLDSGLSFPTARQKALASLGLQDTLLTMPNNILAVEYSKAILQTSSKMKPLVICRKGSYHAETAEEENPSATALRKLMLEGQSTLRYMPQAAYEIFQNAPLHTLQAGERAVLARLRWMTEAEFQNVPYGSEGLWRKLMHAAGEKATLEEILEAVKSKRYTRSRLDRMVMCAFLGISQDELYEKVPYVRVLALNDRGREILRRARNTGTFCNAGEAMEGSYAALEHRAGSLYGLFGKEKPEEPDVEARRRVCYLPEGK